MKTRLNLTIEDHLLKNTKLYARRHHKSVSTLVEDYFKTLNAKSGKEKKFTDLVKELPPPRIPIPEGDLKELYYEDRKEKYGF